MKTVCIEYISQDELISQIRALFTEFSTKNTSIEEDILTRKQVRELLQISLPTLHTWIKQGKLKAYRKGRRIYFLKTEILASLEKLSNQKYKKN